MNREAQFPCHKVTLYLIISDPLLGIHINKLNLPVYIRYEWGKYLKTRSFPFF